MRRGADLVYGLLVNESDELVMLVRRSGHNKRPRYTVPGGVIQPTDSRPEDILARSLGVEADAITVLSLVHVELRASRQELVFVGRLAADHVRTTRGASRPGLRYLALTPEGLLQLDPHPPAAAGTVKRALAEGRNLLSLPDLRESRDQATKRWTCDGDDWVLYKVQEEDHAGEWALEDSRSGTS